MRERGKERGDLVGMTKHACVRISSEKQNQNAEKKGWNARKKEERGRWEREGEGDDEEKKR